MSDLRNNVTSDWIRDTGFFGHTPHRISVSLFVEGDDDVHRDALHRSCTYKNSIYVKYVLSECYLSIRFKVSSIFLAYASPRLKGI